MKQKNLNISKRDQQLLTILLAVVIVFIMYYTIAGPAYDKGVLLKNEMHLAEEDLQRMQTTIEQAPELKKDVVAKRIELQEKYKLFLYKIDEPKLIHKMDNLMSASGFDIDEYVQSELILSKISFSFSDYIEPRYALLDIARELNPDLAKLESEEESGVKPAEDSVVLDQVEQMDIGIGLSGVGFESIYKFLKAVEGLERSFIVSNITIEKGSQASDLSGQLILRAISLPKIDEAEKEDWVFAPIVPKGKTTPF